MAKKQSAKKQRAQVKDLPKKRKKLSTPDMKKVKGGFFGDIHQPLNIAGHEVNLDAGQGKTSGFKK